MDRAALVESGSARTLRNTAGVVPPAAWGGWASNACASASASVASERS